MFIFSDAYTALTHWGRVTHICVGKLIIIGSDNGLSPWRRQAIIWTNAVIWSMGPLGTNFSEILIEIHTFSFKKMHLKMSSAKCRLFCLGLNVLRILCSLFHSVSMPVTFAIEMSRIRYDAISSSSSDLISKRIHQNTFHMHNISTIISQMYSSGGWEERSWEARRVDNRYFTIIQLEGSRVQGGLDLSFLKHFST